MRTPALAALLAVSVLISGACATVATEGGGSPVEGRHSAPEPAVRVTDGVVAERPNIVLITTDDQTTYDLRYMPHTRRLLGRQGTRFSHAVAPHPLCCPSRAMMLTGQYAHNNGVRSNTAAMVGGYDRLNPQQTFATWLHDDGYRTAFVGKYLNEYEEQVGHEEGWDVWNPIIDGVYRYYDYTTYENGHPKRHRNVHSADLVAARTVAYINRFTSRHSDRPFLIWSSQVAPHGSCAPDRELTCAHAAVPARRHRHLFPNTKLPARRTPNFHETDLSDKSSLMAGRSVAKLRKGRSATANMQFKFRRRIQSLQAVDEGVVRTVAALRRAKVLDETLIVFASDNGYLLGEHGLIGKNVPYEEAMRVPVLVRGPGIARGRVSAARVALTDLAPTFLDVAGANTDLDHDGFEDTIVDGESLLGPAARQGRLDRDTVLVQAGPTARWMRDGEGWLFRGVRTSRYSFVRFPSRDGMTAEFEMYDLRRDPYELESVAEDPRYADARAELEHRLAVLGSCAGARCRQRFGPVPSPTS